MNRGVRNVVLVGEKAVKLDFVCSFLSEYSRVSLRELCRDTYPAIEVIHSDDYMEHIKTDKTENCISVLSAVLLDGINFFADLSETDWINCTNIQNADLIMFIEGYPFTTDSLHARIELMEKFLIATLNNHSMKNIQFRVVFFKDKDQHFGATDRVDIDAALKCASEIVTQKLDESHCTLPINAFIDFKIYNGVSDLTDILSCNIKILKTLTAISSERFRQWQRDLDCYCDDYNLDYLSQFEPEFRFHTIHNNINKFSVVKGTSDIMKKYRENYLKKCFGEVKKVAIELYKWNVQSICFWDIEKDIMILGDKLDKLCSDVLTFKEKLSCHGSQADYQKMLTEKKIDIKFANKVKEFEQIDVPNFVYQYLKKKEEILLGVFNE